MISNICFYNHYHRGDLFTHKEFIRQIKKETSINLFYYHYNHPKVNKDLDIPLVQVEGLSSSKVTYLNNDTFFINTWIGAYPDIFNEYGGVNLQSLSNSWKLIFDKINKVFNTNLEIKIPTEYYLPSIDFSKFNLIKTQEFLQKVVRSKKVLFCNGTPMSNQSFSSDLKNEIEYFAKKYVNIVFICTKKFSTAISNIYFTDDIIQDNEEHSLCPPWHDRAINNCDLNEISYISTFCDIIIGKNSGPFVFCETKQNFMNKNKTIISFSKGAKESMSNEVNLKCNYILQTNHELNTIVNTIEKELLKL